MLLEYIFLYIKLGLSITINENKISLKNNIYNIHILFQI